MSKPVIVEYAPVLSLSCMVAGIILLALGSCKELGIFDFDTGLSLWIIIPAGLLLFLIGVLWFASFMKKVKEFRKLIDEKSKAVFIRNLDEIEYLAWQLPMRYEEEVLNRKRELKIK